MAKVNDFKLDQVILFRGVLDFYRYKGVLPVVRKWPKKISPPYTTAQATAQKVFGMSRKVLSALSDKVINTWKYKNIGVRKNWTDQFTSIYMYYWGYYHKIPPVVIDYTIYSESDYKYIEYEFLQQDVNDPTINEQYKLISEKFYNSDFTNYPHPIYTTLYTADNVRLPCPYIKIYE